MSAAMKSGLKLDAAKRAELNSQLRLLEQALLSPDGLPGRSWFRNMIYAPGLKTGYGAKTLPGIREAVEDRRWAEAEKFAITVAGVLDDYADRLDKITALLKSGG
jgi:N-acetylated-alpha-linked acidic dipeptidase